MSVYILSIFFESLHLHNKILVMREDYQIYGMAIDIANTVFIYYYYYIHLQLILLNSNKIVIKYTLKRYSTLI